MPAPKRNAICLLIDRLHWGYLGCYGNTWIATPAFDRLATESFVFDQALVDSTKLSQLYATYWSGSPRFARMAARRSTPSLPAALSAAGVHCTLATDEADLLELEDVQKGGLETVALSAEDRDELADDPTETAIYRGLQSIAQQLTNARPPFLLWAHLRGLGGAWDAPYELRAQYSDEGDPDPPEFARLPTDAAALTDDPDVLWGVRQAYAGQVSLLDLCLAEFLAEFFDSPLADTALLMVASPRGLALGEHGSIGLGSNALHSELVQTPLFIRLPEGEGAASRSSELVQSQDIAATLADYWELDWRADARFAHSLLAKFRGEQQVQRDRAAILGEHRERGLRTSAWYFRETDADGESNIRAGQLYAKPDDAWEVNDVADRCLEIADAMRAACDELEHAAQADDGAKLTPLDEALVRGLA